MESIFQTVTIAIGGIGRIIVPEAPSWRRVLIGPITGGTVFLSAGFSEGALTDTIPAVTNSAFVLSPNQMLYGTVNDPAPVTISIHISHMVEDEMKHPHVEYDEDRIP